MCGTLGVPTQKGGCVNELPGPPPAGDDSELRRLAQASVHSVETEADKLAALPAAASPVGHEIRALLAGLELGLIGIATDLDETKPRPPEPPE